MRNQDDASAVHFAMTHPTGLAGRLVIALTWSLGLLVSLVVQAAEPVESSATPATSEYTTDGRMPLGTIMGRFDALSTAHGWIAETIYDYLST